VKKEPEDQKKRKADEDVKESPAKKPKPEKKEKKSKFYIYKRLNYRNYNSDNRNYESVDDVKKAIVANPGGKPKVKPKFSNWVKNTMKCQNEEWIEQLWDWHKAENKL